MRTTLTRTWHLAATCCLGIMAPATALAQLSIPLQPQTYHDGAYHVSTHGASDGSIALTMEDGIPPYSYMWSTGDTVAGISGLAAGYYQVVVTDSAGVADSASVTLLEPPLMEVSLSATPASCHNMINGSASVSVSGGIPPYALSWSPGDTTVHFSGLGAGMNISGLAAGTYPVTVTSSCGAVVTDSVTVGSPSQMTLTMSHDGDPLCPADTVTLSVSASGGTPPYAYHWDSGAFTQQVKRKMQGQWGMFHVQVTDHANCSMVDSITVEGPTPFTATMNYLPQANGTPFSCDTCNDATVQLHLSGGTAPYTVLWSTGHTAMLLEGMYADSAYWAEATDANGCVWQSDTMSIPRGTAFEQQLGVFLFAHQYAGGHHVSHAGAEDGSIEAVAVGGMSPYAYLWNTGDTLSELTGLGAGVYSVTVTDNNGTVRTRSKTLTAPPPLSATVTGGLGSCMTGGGSLNAHPNGGTPPYQFAWSLNDSLYPAAFNQSYLDISGEGIYKVHVTDANADTVSAQMEVTPIPTLTTALSVQDIGQGYHAVCEGDTVQLLLSVEGGMGPYSYLWEHGSFKKQPKVTEGGWKHVRVTDAHGCTADDSIHVVMPEELEAEIRPHFYTEGHAFSCDTCNDGILYIEEILGGVGPYSILWHDGSSADSLTGIYADSLLSLTLTDALGCVFHETGSLPRGDLSQGPVIVEKSQYPGGYNVSCHGCTDGWVNIHIIAVPPPVSFLWNDGDTLAHRTGMAAGDYTVLITDGHGNSGTIDIHLSGPQGMAAHISSHAGSCHGMVQGSLHASVMGGTPPYSYGWTHDGQPLPDQWHELWVKEAGIYTLTVTDANGTTAHDSTEVGMGQELSAWATAPEKYDGAHAGCTVADGTIELHISGGVPPYSVNINGNTHHRHGQQPNAPGWDHGHYYHWLHTEDAAVVLDSMAAAQYSIHINDATGCYAGAWVELRSPGSFRLSTAATEYPNGHYVSCDTCTDAALTATAHGAYGAVEFVWVEMPDEHAPIRLRGASLFMSDMEDDVSDPWFFGEGVSDMVVATGAEAQGLRPEVMHVLGARDGLGCLSQKMFTLERPAPAAPPAPPAWGMHGNDGSGTPLAGEGAPWFGTGDSTDVVMKANGVPQLRLGADGVTSVEGQLRLGGLQEVMVDTATAQLRMLVGLPDGSVAMWDGTGGFPYPGPTNDSPTHCNPGGHAHWIGIQNRLFAPCPDVLVGIGTENPNVSLDVRGEIRSNFYMHTPLLGVNTHDTPALLTVRSDGSNTISKTLEIQDTDGAPALRVYNSGDVIVGHVQQQGDVATLHLGNSDHYIRSGHGMGLRLGTYGADDALVIEEGSGKVIIGQQTVVNGPHTDAKLSVFGKIVARELFVHRDEGIWGWPDYVFANDYKLRTIEEMQNFIESNNHLPGVPSAAEVNREGIGLTSTTIALLEKIEELSLYIIQLNERVKELEQQLKGGR